MGRPTAVLLIILAVVAAIYLLFMVVFPWVDATFVTDPVLEGRGAGAVSWAAHASRRSAAAMHTG